LVGLLVVIVAAVSACRPLPAGQPFDYQIGGAYPPPAGTGVVSRDWFDADPLPDAYNICYVNAFQTQPDSSGVRIDETANWPRDVVLSDEDPAWPGEYFIDIATAGQRDQAAAHVARMVQVCAAKGFDAVEYDNLDSWTRVPNQAFDQEDAVAYATLLVGLAHQQGLAAAQKNTAELVTSGDAARIGFDFAVVESCGRYRECQVFDDFYNGALVAIEYTRADFDAACAVLADTSAVVLRDQLVTRPGSPTYTIDQCHP
jgi:hypothetical protein